MQYLNLKNFVKSFSLVTLLSTSVSTYSHVTMAFKTESQLILNAWIQKQVTHEINDRSTHFRDFLERLIPEKVDEFSGGAKSQTNILPNLTKNMNNSYSYEKLLEQVTSIKNSFEEDSFSQDKNTCELLTRVTDAFIAEYGAYFTEETLVFVESDRNGFMLALNQHFIPALYESVEKKIPFAFDINLQDI